MSFLSMLERVADIKNYEVRELRNLHSELPNESDLSQYSEQEIKKFTEIAEAIAKRNEELSIQLEERKAIMNGLIDGSIQGKVIAKFDGKDHERNSQMETENKQLRSLQTYLTGGELSVEERAALVTSNAGAVIPTEITNNLILDKKYSDLLHRATVYSASHLGKITVPVTSGQGANWKAELADAADNTPAFTNIVLEGYELMSFAQISAAAYNLTAPQFEEQLRSILQGALIEKMEESFIKGTGVGQPTGLETLTYTADNTVTAAAEIGYSDLAKGLSKLPQQYSRNAIIIANNDTIFNLNKHGNEFEETLKKEIVPNEHVPSGVAYIVSPSELYVRFSDVMVEADRSSSFRKNAVDLRSTAVADARWNPKAVIKVTASE